MRVSQRLFLAVLPAILGVFTVAGLAYWGEYAHQAPRALIIVAVVAAVISLGMAWHNTRYVARRVERLVPRTTGRTDSGDYRPRLLDLASAVTGGVLSRSEDPDELDAIESTVSDLNAAIKAARADGERRAKEAESREAEYTAVLDEVARLLASRLENAALPLHVLLSSPFGSLNENQEEMLTAAQSALDDADMEIRRLRSLLALDRGALTVTRQPMSLSELLKPALATAQARGRDAHVTVQPTTSSTAPRVAVDPMQVQAALTTIFVHAVARAPLGGEITIIAEEGEEGRIRITVRSSNGAGTAPDEPSLELKLARRLILLQHGTLDESSGQTIIGLPAEAPVRLTHSGAYSHA